MKPLVSIRAALADPDLFGKVLAGDSWALWRILLIAICGEALTEDERVIFEALTGRPYEPGERVEEFWGIFGRRSGKTRAMAVLAAYLAALCEWSHLLAPGERASLPLLSASVPQSAKMLQYLTGIFTTVPALKALVTGQTNDSISFSTRVDIECAAASFRTIRGGTAIGIFADETGFWRNEATANPDTEILAAARPMLATTSGMLIAISSPYAQRGELWGAYKRDYGPNGDPLVLVAKAASRTMNPGLSQKIIDRAMERDPASASAEYMAEFRNDIESFVSPAAVDGAVFPDRIELPPVQSATYYAFTDAAGGSGGGDSMTLAIAHAEGDVAVLDLVRERRPPFSPDETVKDFTATLAKYDLREVTGDRWASGFVAEAFQKSGFTYKTSEKPKSDLYRELLPLLNSKRVELLDLPRLRAQLIGLERKTARGGRDSIDHAPGGRDDIANAAAGALVIAAGIGRSGFNLEVYMKAFCT
jgi:hypothetical protein